MFIHGMKVRCISIDRDDGIRDRYSDLTFGDIYIVDSAHVINETITIKYSDGYVPNEFRNKHFPTKLFAIIPNNPVYKVNDYVILTGFGAFYRNDLEPYIENGRLKLYNRYRIIEKHKMNDRVGIECERKLRVWVNIDSIKLCGKLTSRLPAWL